MTKRGPVVVAGLGGRDPLRLLLRNPALVIVADPCAVHRAVFDLRLAALKCLGHREFLQLGRADRWTRLFPRLGWLVSGQSLRGWDGRVASLGAFPEPDPAEFDLMKVRAARFETVDRPLDDLLAQLPRAFADAVFPGSACGTDPERLRMQMRRVLAAPVERRPAPADVPLVPEEAVR